MSIDDKIRSRYDVAVPSFIDNDKTMKYLNKEIERLKSLPQPPRYDREEIQTGCKSIFASAVLIFLALFIGNEITNEYVIMILFFGMVLPASGLLMVGTLRIVLELVYN